MTIRKTDGRRGRRARRPALRRYDAVPELDLASTHFPEPPPLAAFARLAWAGIRLRDDGRWLVAWVPAAVAASIAWPHIDRRLARYAPWLADLAAVVESVRKRFSSAAIEARLRAVVPPLAEAAIELAGGRKRFQALLRQPLTGARLDLACLIFGQLVQIEGIVAAAIESCSGEATEGDEPECRLLPFRTEAQEGRGSC